VITGSFNFIRAAEENNAENLLVIRDKKLAERYAKNWWELNSEVVKISMLKVSETSGSGAFYWEE